MWEKQLHQMCSTCLKMRIYLILRNAFDSLQKTIVMPTRVGGTRWVGHLLLAVDNALWITSPYEQLMQLTQKVSILHLFRHSCSSHTNSTYNKSRYYLIMWWKSLLIVQQHPFWNVYEKNTCMSILTKFHHNFSSVYGCRDYSMHFEEAEVNTCIDSCICREYPCHEDVFILCMTYMVDNDRSS